MAKMDMSLFRGTTKVLRIAVTDNSKPSQPVNFVTGDVVVLSVKEDLKSVTKVIEKVITTFSGNTVAVEFTPTDTQTLETKKYTYDVQARYVNGNVKMLIDPSNLTLVQTVADGDLEE